MPFTVLTNIYILIQKYVEGPLRPKHVAFGKKSTYFQWIVFGFENVFNLLAFTETQRDVTL